MSQKHPMFVSHTRIHKQNHIKTLNLNGYKHKNRLRTRKYS